jgi:hypothetical protein
MPLAVIGLLVIRRTRRPEATDELQRVAGRDATFFA